MQRQLKTALAAVVIGWGLVGVAVAGPYEDGIAAYDRGDYATALKLWRPLAEQGTTVAQIYLGFMFSNGRGAPRDYVEAAKWYRLAAEQGAAAAQHSLGYQYFIGQGVRQDLSEAARWFRLAAEQGHARAQNDIGVLYDEGLSVPQDYVQAHKWFNLAASRFSPADRELALKNRDRVASKMTPAQIAEAQKLAREWKPKGQ